MVRVICTEAKIPCPNIFPGPIAQNDALYLSFILLNCNRLWLLKLSLKQSYEMRLDSKSVSNQFPLFLLFLTTGLRVLFQRWNEIIYFLFKFYQFKHYFRKQLFQKRHNSSGSSRKQRSFCSSENLFLSFLMGGGGEVKENWWGGR